MSYYQELQGLGSLSAETYGAGTQLVGGYQVIGLTTNAGTVPGLLQQAMTAVMPGVSIVRAGWGPYAGVPSGHAYIVVTVGAGITGAQMNTVFAQVGQRLQGLIPGSRVTNTYAHVTSRGSTAAVPAAPGIPGLDIFTTTPGTTVSPTIMPQEEPGFFSSTVGGIPMWGVLLGGTVAAVGVAYVVMSPKRSTANRRRRRHRRH